MFEPNPFTAQLLRNNTAALKLIESVAGGYEEDFSGAYRVISFDI